MHQVYSCCERERERELSIRASKLVAQQLFSDLPIVFSGPLRRVAGLWASKKTSLAAARPAARGCLVAVCQAQKKYCQSSTVFVRSWCIIYIIAQCLYYRIHFRICELGGKNVGIEQIWLKWLHGMGGGGYAFQGSTISEEKNWISFILSKNNSQMTKLGCQWRQTSLDYFCFIILFGSVFVLFQSMSWNRSRLMSHLHRYSQESSLSW